MKTHAANRCLVAATVSILVMLSSAVAAQEEQPQPQEAPPQRLFVSDKLVLNVYAEPDQASERVATIETGDSVDELERAESFIRVRLENGREGWVGVNYLTRDPPAAVRIRELERGQKAASQTIDKKSADEIAKLKKESAALRAQVDQLQAAAAAAPVAAVDQPADAPMEQLSPPVDVTPADAGGAIWMWLLIVVLASTLAFAAGYQTLARRIRKKFGGLKIY